MPVTSPDSEQTCPQTLPNVPQGGDGGQSCPWLRIAEVHLCWRHRPQACARVCCRYVCPCPRGCSTVHTSCKERQRINRASEITRVRTLLFRWDHRPRKKGFAQGHGALVAVPAPEQDLALLPLQSRVTSPWFPWADRTVAKAGLRPSGKPAAILRLTRTGRLVLFPGTSVQWSLWVQVHCTLSGYLQLRHASLYVALEKAKKISLPSTGEQVWRLQQGEGWNQADWLPSAPPPPRSHPALRSWRSLASSTWILRASRWCGQQGAGGSSGGGEQGQGGDSPALPLRACGPGSGCISWNPSLIARALGSLALQARWEGFPIVAALGLHYPSLLPAALLSRPLPVPSVAAGTWLAETLLWFLLSWISSWWPSSSCFVRVTIALHFLFYV